MANKKANYFKTKKKRYYLKNSLQKARESKRRRKQNKSCISPTIVELPEQTFNKRKRPNTPVLEQAREFKRLKKIHNTESCESVSDNVEHPEQDFTIEKDTNSRVESDKNVSETSGARGFCMSPELNSFTIEREKSPEVELSIDGRRIVDFQFFMDQLKIINQHNNAFGCSLENLKIVKECSSGLHSYFVMKCNMCNSKFKLHTSDKSQDNMNVNHGAVIGAMMTGAGMSNLNELLASVNLPILKQKTYSRCHDEIAKWWQDTAEASMLEAAKEEADAAIACSNVKDGIPVITVVADGCWSKRSYKTNYSALSGVAAIIGNKTGKVLYMDVKNKYCVICARAATKSQPPVAHDCQKNHSGSSTSMEQNVIVEGFKTSIEKRNLIYGTLIADGDASTYKKILESRPYTNVQVEKIECTNHLLRTILGVTKDTSIPLAERRLLTSERIKRLRISIKSAARFRKAQNLPVAEQIINLKKDILNSPCHIFGDHSRCEPYYCTDVRKSEENLVDKVPTMLKKIIHHTTQIAYHSKSLLHNVNNNKAEQFNSVVAKLVGGKRVNFSLKNSYTARCHAAVVSFNSARPQYIMYKRKFNKSPGGALKRIEMARLKRKQTEKNLRRCKRRLILSDTDKSHYGEECQRPDMAEEEYSDAKTNFLKNLKEQVNNRQEIERDTILQAESALWLELRRCLLTASTFSKVCKRRENISSAPLVKSLLYCYSLQNVPSIQHGKNNESVAIKQLQLQENISVEKCGLFVDENHFFLGASPDGLCNDGIVEVKCPSSAFGMSAEDGIKQRKIKFWNKDGSINKRHDWHFQIQGQLHITKKNYCLFAVWTGKDFPLKIEKIPKDDEFWKNTMEPKLIDFYNKCLLPEIVDPRKARSMPIRDTKF